MSSSNFCSIFAKAQDLRKARLRHKAQLNTSFFLANVHSCASAHRRRIHHWAPDSRSSTPRQQHPCSKLGKSQSRELCHLISSVQASIVVRDDTDGLNAFPATPCVVVFPGIS